MVKIVDVNTASVRLFEADNKTQLLASLDKIFVARVGRRPEAAVEE